MNEHWTGNLTVINQLWVYSSNQSSLNFSQNMAIFPHVSDSNLLVDPEGVQGARLNPPPPPLPHPPPFLVFKYPMTMKLFGLSETKLFHFHGIVKQIEIKQQCEHPYLYTYEPPFQKSWICLWNLCFQSLAKLCMLSVFVNQSLFLPWINFHTFVIFCWHFFQK